MEKSERKTGKYADFSKKMREAGKTRGAERTFAR